MDFTTRSYKKELLDGNGIPFADIRQNMHELDFINTYLGGHGITVAGFKQLLKNNSSISVCEIGCGGGDNLLAIEKWCKKNNVRVSITGIDINEDCIAIAKSRFSLSGALLINADYQLVDLSENKPDIVFSSLFCHHFTYEQLQQMLGWMRRHSGNGFFINDLHRHFLAYYSIKILTGIFSKSYLVKNDAPLSVQRGFIRKEWIELFKQSGIEDYTIEWKWAFRWLVICRHS